MKIHNILYDKIEITSKENKKFKRSLEECHFHIEEDGQIYIQEFRKGWSNESCARLVFSLHKLIKFNPWEFEVIANAFDKDKKGFKVTIKGTF